MDAGIVGAPGSGRTTVFRALLAHRAPRSAGDRKTAANIGSIQVQDPRLTALAERFKPQKTTPIEIRVQDLCPSLEPGFPSAELEQMKRMEVLLLVVPAFSSASPEALVRAFDSLLSEICFEDLAAVEKRLARADREKLDDTNRAALEGARAMLESDRPVLHATLSEAERRALRGYAFVTDRSLIVLQNSAEAAAAAGPDAALAARCAERGLPLLALCGTLEAELADLAGEERAAFLQEYGVEEPAGAAVTRAILEQADTIPFFTVGEDECRAWSIARGTLARAAGGKIHSDIERGFIRAEVLDYNTFASLPGGLTEARKLGKLRLEGKDYVVQDGDIINFRFNV